MANYYDWFPTSASTAAFTSSSCKPPATEELTLTLDELNYLVRQAKGNKKLTGIFSKLLNDITIELPF